MKKAVAVTFAALTMGLGGTVSALAADLARYEPAPQEQDDRNGVKIGYLTCDIGGGVGYVIGSAKELDCTFQSTLGARRTDHYTGAIRKMGVDLGFTTQGRLVWAVFAPTAVTTAARSAAFIRAQRLKSPSVSASAPTFWLAARPAPSSCRRSA
jgi:hypothetical protein